MGMMAALLTLVVAGICVRLGCWQLSRLDERRETNAALSAAVEQPTVELDSTLAARLMREPPELRFRRVRVRGEFDHARQVVLRGRSLGGRPGVHLLTPLRIEGSTLRVWINRGWVGSPDGASVEARRYDEPGVRTVTGLAQPLGAPGVVTPLPLADGTVSFQRVNDALLRDRVPYAFVPLQLDALPDSAAPLQRLAVPELSEGNHLSYAVQWFGFAGVALAGFVVILWRAWRGEPK